MGCVRGRLLSSRPTAPGPAPTVLVGNPPFREERAFEGTRLQRASLFVSKYLDLLTVNSMLGLVLPETFLENSSCSGVRARLMDECDILELWNLPEGIFPMSSVATVVLLAKRKPKSIPHDIGPVRVERVSARPERIRDFLNGGQPRFSYIVPSTEEWRRRPNYYIFTSSLEDDVWGVMQGVGRLGDVAQVRNGIIVGEPQRKSHLSDKEGGAEWKPWLSGASDLQPFAVQPKRKLFVRWPGDLERPRTNLDRVFATRRAKVLVNASRNPGNPWRTYAAVDDVGYFPSQGLHCVVPTKRSVTLEEIAAVLNSPLGSAWVDSRNRRRWIADGTLRAMPFPEFSESSRGSVVRLVREVMAFLRGGAADRDDEESRFEALRGLVTSIDELVFEAFGIGQEGRSALDELFAGHRRPGMQWANEPQAGDSSDGADYIRGWPVTGQVLEVSAKDDSIVMWLRGFQDSQPFATTIPDNMPGWALRPDSAFQAEIPSHLAEGGEFRPNEMREFSPLDFAYSSSQELENLIGHPSKLDDLYER